MYGEVRLAIGKKVNSESRVISSIHRMSYIT